MEKKVTTMALTAAMIISMSSTVLAAGWQKDSTGWWWQNDNGSYPSNTWHWIDANNDGVSECYYFDGNGYCLLNTITPDGCSVNADGAWVVDGVVQTQKASTGIDRIIINGSTLTEICTTYGTERVFHKQ